MGRGIEGRVVFASLRDYAHFVERLGRVLGQGSARCLGWALMPNHYHILLRTGGMPLTRLMARLLTSFALGFNKRHHRQGYVFQGRYLSLLCEDDESLAARVRYVHLNPLRAKLVESVEALEAYPWCGHGVIVGRRRAPWQDVETVLGLFGGHRKEAVEAYRRFVAEGVGLGPPADEMPRAGVVRQGGEWKFVEVRGKGKRAGEESIAGGIAFVERVLAQEQDQEARRSWLRRTGWTPAKAVARAAAVCGVPPNAVYGAGKQAAQQRARALACKWLVEDLGLSGAVAARLLRISQPTVSRQVAHGRILATKLGRRLEDADDAGDPQGMAGGRQS